MLNNYFIVIILPVQYVPFRLYPRLLEQKNDPSVSLQYALTSQLWVLFAHSFTSFKEKMVCYNEWRKICVSRETLQDKTDAW